MRSRKHAIGTCMVAGVLPLLGWVSLVVVALVCLRQGALAGSMVLIWAILPFSFQTYVVGDPTVFSIFGIFVLASLLRFTVSWEIVLLTLVFYSVIAGLLFDWMVLDKFMSVYSSYLENFEMPIVLTDAELRAIIADSVILLIAYGMIAMLLLARWCQASLYNPGGFQKEFHLIKLSPMLSGGILIALIASYSMSNIFGRWLPLLTLPIVIASLGFVHWLLASRGMSKRWVVFFYLTLVFFGHLVYPLLIFVGFMDSFLNLRYRLQRIQKD